MITKEQEGYIERHKSFIDKYQSKNIHLSPYNRGVNESVKSFISTGEERSIVVFGNCGVGKTHLIHFLIANEGPERSLYIDTSSFIETLYAQIKLNQPVQEWIDWFCTYELVVFDNFHLIQNKPKIINFFQSLISKVRQQDVAKVIFIWTKNSSVESILYFGRNIIFPDPDKETLKSIAGYFLEDNFKKLKLTNKALELLIDNVPMNIKVLTDKLLELALTNTEEHLPFTLIKEDDIKQFLNKKARSNPEDSEQTIQNLVQKICLRFKFEPNEIMSSSRKKDIVYKRNIVIYLVKKLSNLSHQEIGEAFNRNHSTISHSIQQIEMKMKDKYFKEYLKTFL